MSSTTQKTKVALIVGATQGIGEATAELLAKEGWRVVLSGRQEAKGQEIVSRICKAGGEAVFIQADVSTEVGVKKLHDEAISIWGHLDAAVNNAGISTDANPLAESDTDKFTEMIQVNVLGVYWCMKNQLNHMKDRGFGRIVNLASIAGLHGILYTGPYCATKHAVVGLTKTAALEYATQGITVNAVAPGAIKTAILGQAIEAGAYSEESIADMFPQKRMGVSEDIARAISFLLNSPYATGTVLAVDGGFGAR